MGWGTIGKTILKEGVEQTARLGKHVIKNATEGDVLLSRIRAASANNRGLQTSYLNPLEMKYLSDTIQQRQTMKDLYDQLGGNFIPSDFDVNAIGKPGSPKTSQEWLDYKRHSKLANIDDVGKTPLDSPRKTGNPKRSDRATSLSITQSPEVSAYGESMRTGEAIASPEVYQKTKAKVKGKAQHHEVLKKEADPFHTRMRQLEADGLATKQDIVNLEFMGEILDVPAGSRQSAITDLPGRNKSWGKEVGGDQHNWLHDLAKERGAQLQGEQLEAFKKHVMSLNDPQQITEEYFDFLIRQAIPMKAETRKILERLQDFSIDEIAAMTKEQWNDIMNEFEVIEEMDLSRIIDNIWQGAEQFKTSN